MYGGGGHQGKPNEWYQEPINHSAPQQEGPPSGGMPEQSQWSSTGAPTSAPQAGPMDDEFANEPPLLEGI
jgi:hypothetical protein